MCIQVGIVRARGPQAFLICIGFYFFRYCENDETKKKSTTYFLTRRRRVERPSTATASVHCYHRSALLYADGSMTRWNVTHPVGIFIGTVTYRVRHDDVTTVTRKHRRNTVVTLRDVPSYACIVYVYSVAQKGRKSCVETPLASCEPTPGLTATCRAVFYRDTHASRAMATRLGDSPRRRSVTKQQRHYSRCNVQYHNV